MKCEKCKEREATFYYSSSINGEKTERHLCADCAREEGFGGALDYRPSTMFGGMLDSFFGDLFTPARSMFPAFDMFGSPMRRMMAPALPRFRIVVGEPETASAPQSEAETKIPEDAGEDVKARRELAALKAQLETAVKAEDFEKAIELRDQIRKLEKEG